MQRKLTLKRKGATFFQNHQVVLGLLKKHHDAETTFILRSQSKVEFKDILSDVRSRIDKLKRKGIYEVALYIHDNRSTIAYDNVFAYINLLFQQNMRITTLALEGSIQRCAQVVTNTFSDNLRNLIIFELVTDHQYKVIGVALNALENKSNLSIHYGSTQFDLTNWTQTLQGIACYPIECSSMVSSEDEEKASESSVDNDKDEIIKKLKAEIADKDKIIREQEERFQGIKRNTYAILERLKNSSPASQVQTSSSPSPLSMTSPSPSSSVEAYIPDDEDELLIPEFDKSRPQSPLQTLVNPQHAMSLLFSPFPVSWSPKTTDDEINKFIL